MSMGLGGLATPSVGEELRHLGPKAGENLAPLDLLARGQDPDVVARLMILADRARHELGDGVRSGKSQRPAGFVEKPTPRSLANP